MSTFDDAPIDHNESDSNGEDLFSILNCPVKEPVNMTLKSSKETRRALGRLREILLSCDTCPRVDQCELREQFYLQIDLVIAEINEEWGW